MLVLWKNNVSEHKFSLRVKVHHFLLGQHLESVFERRRWAVQGMPLCIHAHFNVGCIVTRSKAILQLLVRPRFIIVYQYRQLRTVSGKNWRDKISHVDLLHSVKFGTNQKFRVRSTRCWNQKHPILYQLMQTDMEALRVLMSLVYIIIWLSPYMYYDTRTRKKTA